MEERSPCPSRTVHDLFRQDLGALLGLLAEKKVQPVIARRFPLSQARLAHETLAQGGIVGKIVLVTDPSVAAAA